MWLLLTACNPVPAISVPATSVPATSVPATSVPTSPTSEETEGHAGTDTATEGTTTHTSTPPVDASLSILSLNLHCLKLDGTPFASNAERFAAIAAEVEAREVDAIAAQEVCVGAEDARALLADALLDATGETWSWQWASAHLAWEGTPDEADEGVAVFSRRISGVGTEIAYASPGQLRRVALLVQLDGGPTLTTVHLDYGDPAAREDQARQTAVFPLVSGLDAVVAGDFNDLEGSPAHAAMGALGWVDGAADLDPGRIDHLFVHQGAGWTPVAAEEVLTSPPVSDHPGVLVVLEPRTPPIVEITRFVATVDVGFGSWVALRGDAAPLSWDRGWWAVPTAADRWELVLPSLVGPFAYKALRDDTDWEQGADHPGTPGVPQEWSPAF